MSPAGVHFDIGTIVGYESFQFSRLLREERVYAFKLTGTTELLRKILARNEALNFELLPSFSKKRLSTSE